uniref:UBC core domain-containing protein n=1 Tax=Neolamprologus brichardi TaxID=32507 RepID=A0A3Q4GD83_NEOBR
MAQNRHHVASSQKALMLEMKSLQDEPVEGFKITLVDESDLYNWEVAIFGPPNTHYEGVTNSARLLYNDFVLFPPNAKPNGDVCISILHPPVDDPQSGELPSERWNPTQNVRTILLSVISLLNEPNTFSPANVDASVMYRKWRDSKGKDREYIEIISPFVVHIRLSKDMNQLHRYETEKLNRAKLSWHTTQGSLPATVYATVVITV